MKDPGFILRIAIALGYMALAVFLFVNPHILGFLSREMTLLFGVVIFLYGSFRAYRAYQTYKDDEE